MNPFNWFYNLPNLIYHFQFANRNSAADLLSSYITSSIHKFNKKGKRKIAIFGIPCGGVVIANAIAKRIQSDYRDIIITKRIRSPLNREISIGAIAEDGSLFINQQLVNKFNVSNEYLRKEINDCLNDIEYKKKLYYYKINGNNDEKNISNKISIIVDDGSATGSSFIAAAKYLRKFNPFRIILAAPIIPNNVIESLNKESDSIITILKPKNHFYYIQQYYKEFNNVNENEVMKIINNW